MTDREEAKARYNPTIIIVSILFIFSLILAVVGVTLGRENKSEIKRGELTESVENEADVYINKFFEGKSGFANGEEKVLLEDPFRNECDPTSGDGTPSISSNIVCLR